MPNPPAPVFRGNHPATVDAKGRLKVPAGFLEALRQRGTRAFITSTDGKSADIYPMSVWEEIESAMRAPAARRNEEGCASDETRQNFRLITSYYGQEAELDSQGRLLLPKLLRNDADTVGKVAVLGLWNYLKVWNLETLTKDKEGYTLTKKQRASIDEDNAAREAERA